MNRNSNVSDSRVGDCEELINIKSQNGALKIVKDNEKVSADIPYRDIIIHDIGSIRNFIGKDSSGVVWFEPESGIVLMRLYEGVEDVYVATLNNMLVISDRANISNKVYLYSNTPASYTLFSSGMDIDITVDVKSDFYSGEHDATENILAPSKTQYLSSCQSVVNKFKVENKTFSEGVFLFAFTLSLYDGTETGMYALRAIGTAVEENPGNANAFISVAEQAGGQTTDLYTRFYWEKFFQEHKLTVSENGSLLSYKDVIKSVNLYVSLPVTRMPIDEDHVTLNRVWFDDNKVEALQGEFIFDVVNPKDSNVEKSLLYRQKSWTLQEFAKGFEYTLEFGGDNQATGKTMGVSASSMDRAGQMFTYNNRLHFFDSAVRLKQQLGNMYQKWSDDYPDIVANVYVYLKVNGEDQVIKYSDITMATRPNDVLLFPAISLPDMIVYPDSRAYKMLIVSTNEIVEGYSGFELQLDLSSSPAYNYAYAFGNNANTGGMTPSDFDESDVNLDNTYTELDALNVTAQGNPLVFPVEHSYLFNGTVMALAYATEPISQTQVGQYPLYVFTDKGIYAMEQGNGGVLYANQIMVNTDKCYGDVVQTRNGVVYMANGSIYILSGRNSLNISLPLSGPVDVDIRRAEAYSQCCISDVLYNVGNNISQVEFQDYLPNAKLAYTPYRDELIVSNPDYQYSYVFSFVHKAWHKITDSFLPVGDNILQRAIFTSAASAKAAQGELVVANAVVTPAHTFSTVQQAIYSGGGFRSGANERYALVIDGVQVSSALFRYPTYLPLMLALLCKDVPYLDCWYDGASHFILSDIAFSEGATAELVQTSTGYSVFSIAFSSYQSVVSIPAKAIGTAIRVASTAGGSVQTRAVKDGDSVLSLAALLNDAINGAANMGMRSDLGTNTLTLTASVPGSAGNDIDLSVNTGDYISIHFEDLSGGKDITLEPGDYSVLVDFTREKDTTKTIHLQTRPISFAEAYTIIRRVVLHCKGDIPNDDNLSLYLFASNNLKQWQCTAAAQKSDVMLDHIRLQRSARAYKYYIIIIGGKVFTSTELSYLTLELEERFGSKIR